MTSKTNLIRECPPNSRDKRKAKKLDELVERDAQDPELRRLSDALWLAAMGSTWRYIVLAHALCRDAIRYVSDTARTGGEDIAGMTRPPAPALEALERGADDCDAKARMLAALLRARGMLANLAKWWDPVTGDLAHVAAEVYFAGKFYHLETILSRARFGDLPNDVPVEADGKWRYS